MKATTNDIRVQDGFWWGTKVCGYVSNGPKKTFTSICLVSPTPAVIYSDDGYLGDGLDLTGKNVLTNSHPEVDGTYWFSASVEPPEYPQIILDLNCMTMVKGVELVNIHVALPSTKSFSIWLAMSADGPWTKGTEINDLENTQDGQWTGPLPLPLQTFLFASPIRARYVKFILLESHYGDTYAGLQYLNPITGRII